MESQPQNPEFSNNPENFHPWSCQYLILKLSSLIVKSASNEHQ